MNNAFFNVVRLSYAVTVAVCAVISLAAAGRLLTSILAGYGDFFTSAVIALFLLPCLKIFVRKLRQKIEPHPDTPKILVTELGVGYRLVQSGAEGDAGAWSDTNAPAKSET